jgi:cation diffusion facilitator family transporter
MSSRPGPADVIISETFEHHRTREREHRAAANRAVAVSAIGLAATGAIELAIALLTGSVALLGDALHNLSDVSTSVVIFVGFWISKKPPSDSHPYGYERAEDLAGLGVAAVIFASAVFAGYQSYEKLIANGGTSDLALGMAAALVGMAGNLAVSRYKARVARRINSVTMSAEANHSWLDTVSSFGALVGLIGVAFGYRWADPVAGFAVTLFILHVGWEVTSEIVHHLMDGVDPAQLQRAREAALSVPAVHKATVRGRWMGRSLTLEVEGQLADNMTLDNAARTGDQVQAAVRAAVDEARHVRWIPRRYGDD